MTMSTNGQSPANRRAKQEQAQAAALNELEVLAERKRRQSNKLRKLRLQRDVVAVSNFRTWREKKSAADEN